MAQKYFFTVFNACMKTIPILNSYPYNNVNQPNPAFRSSTRCVFNSGKQIICNYTKFVREDLDWKKFAMLLLKKYRDVAKVNILNLACSDGSEPLTLMAALLHCLGEQADKFFPIKASDINAEIISEAKSGMYKIDDNDILRLNMSLGHYSDYFSIYNDSNINFPYKLSVLPKYSDKVVFEQMNLLEAIKYIEPKNNVILCRNVLPYLKDKNDKAFINMLAELLDSTSLVVIGCFDNGHDINCLLKSQGFKPYELENVYCKA